MTDNTQLPVPQTLGDVIATDDIGGVKFQRIKMIHGADGVNDGDVSTSNPLPVEIQGSLGTADTRPLGSAVVDGDIGIVTNTVIHGKTTAGGGSFVDVKVNPSGALSVAVGESSLPTGAATETTLTAILALSEQIESMADSINTLVQFLYANSPRIDAVGRAAVNVETGSVTTLTTLTTLTNAALISGQPNQYTGQDAPLHIYDNIKVT